jgi:hypothetical protein
MNRNQYTKEAIKARIFRLATMFWNVQSIASLDPMIKLLIEAVAEEIYIVSDDVATMESRVLEKIANVLTPDLLIVPSPAHAILHASPMEAIGVVNRDHCMRYDNSAFIKKNKLRELMFSPVCQTMLYKGDVAYVIANGALYNYDASRRKHIVSRPEKNYLTPNRIWIALQLDDKIASLSNMSFYIDLPNTPDKNEYLNLLSYSEWQINGNRITMERGIYKIVDDDEVDSSHFLKYEISNRVDDTILKIYHNHYMRIVDTIDSIPHNTRPDFIDQLYSMEVAKQLESDLVWLSIDLPSVFAEYVLDDITINMNTFPVANKFKYTLNNRVEDVLGVIPLVPANNEYFLSVESVRDSQNKHYYELLYDRGNEKNEAGTYTLRRGGCEKFDERNARDFLDRLTDLLNDESAAFAYKSRGGLMDIIYQMETLVAQMNRNSIANEDREIPHYILIDNLKSRDYFEVQYWMTNGEKANNIKEGVALTALTASVFDSKSVILLSATYGGEREPKVQEKIDKYKYVLTTRDRIITVDDIKNFCQMQLGEILSNVDVRKGVAVSEKPKEGLIRTIDVAITLKPYLKDIGEFTNVKGDIKNKLIDKSPDTYNYRVFINN